MVLLAVTLLAGAVVGTLVLTSSSPPPPLLTGTWNESYEGPIAPVTSLLGKPVCTQSVSGTVCVRIVDVTMGTASSNEGPAAPAIHGIPTPRRLVTMMDNTTSHPQNLSFTPQNTHVGFMFGDGMHGLTWGGTGVTVRSVTYGYSCSKHAGGSLVLSAHSVTKVCIDFNGSSQQHFAPRGSAWASVSVAGIAEWDRTNKHYPNLQSPTLSPTLAALNSEWFVSLNISPMVDFSPAPDSYTTLRDYGLSLALVNARDSASLVSEWRRFWPRPTRGPVVLRVRWTVAHGRLAAKWVGDAFLDVRTHCGPTGCGVTRIGAQRVAPGAVGCARRTGTACFQFDPVTGSLPVQGAFAVAFKRGAYAGQRGTFEWTDTTGWTTCRSSSGPCS